MIEKPRRNINIIVGKLQIALKRETTNIIAIGDLLLEAKEQVGHGGWLPWLRSEFGSSASTAENYMSAARFAAKFPSVRNLKLRPTALYWLGARIDEYSPKVLKKILKDADAEWIDQERLEFEKRQRTRDEQFAVAKEALREQLKEQAQAKAASSEAEAVLAEPPPELPPAPPPEAVDFTSQNFDQAVATLLRLRTKPLHSIIAEHTPDQIRDAIAFLQSVIDDKSPKHPDAAKTGTPDLSKAAISAAANHAARGQRPRGPNKSAIKAAADRAMARSKAQ